MAYFYFAWLTLFSIQEENNLIFGRNSTKVLTLIKTFPILIPESLTCVSLLQGTALEAGIFFEHFFSGCLWLSACEKLVGGRELEEIFKDSGRFVTKWYFLQIRKGFIWLHHFGSQVIKFWLRVSKQVPYSCEQKHVSVSDTPSY